MTAKLFLGSVLGNCSRRYEGSTDYANILGLTLLRFEVVAGLDSRGRMDIINPSRIFDTMGILAPMHIC